MTDPTQDVSRGQTAVRTLWPDDCPASFDSLAKNRYLSAFPEYGIVAVSPFTHGGCLDLFHQKAPALGMTVAPGPIHTKAIVRSGTILVYVDCNTPEEMFQGVRMIEAAFPGKEGSIRYLPTDDKAVRKAIREHGELWRLCGKAHTQDEMARFIHDSIITTPAGNTLYHNAALATHYLTKDNVKALRNSPPEKQAACLDEISRLSTQMNSKESNVELTPFNARFVPCGTLESVIADFRKNMVDKELATDFTPAWTSAMYAKMIKQAPPEEEELHLAPEHQMKVEWQPGGRIENRTYVWHPLATPRTRSIITAFLQEHRQYTYFNLGILIESNNKNRPSIGGRREVYVIETGRNGDTDAHICRMLDWDSWQRIDQGRDPRKAEDDATEYTHFIENCDELAYLLGLGQERMRTYTFKEIYNGYHAYWHGHDIDAHCRVRRYVHGMATDKIDSELLDDDKFLERHISLLARQMAPNLVVGRGIRINERKHDEYIHTYFHDGDEYETFDDNGMPAAIRVGDASGLFCDVERPFSAMMPDYKQRLAPLLRTSHLKELATHALVSRYNEIRQLYLENPGRHHLLCDLKVNDPHKAFLMALHEDMRSFKDRARKALGRLRTTTPCQLLDAWAL